MNIIEAKLELLYHRSKRSGFVFEDRMSGAGRRLRVPMLLGEVLHLPTNRLTEELLLRVCRAHYIVVVNEIPRFINLGFHFTLHMLCLYP